MIRSKRALRIKQGNSFAISTDTLISSLSVPFSVPSSREYFHGLLRAEGPRQTGHGFSRAEICTRHEALLIPA